MTAFALASPGRTKSHALSAQTITICAIAAVLCLQLVLAFTKSINWDEYHHFSVIHAHVRGESAGYFQTPFVHLYGWVTTLPGSVIDHIQITRALILPFEALLIVSIIAAARKFTDRNTALLCGLAYASAGYAFTQGLALRADIISASLMMAAVAIALHRPLNLMTIVAVAVLGALAFVSTIKVVLYLPVFIAIFYVRRAEITPWLWIALAASASLLAGMHFAQPQIYIDLLAKLASSSERMFGGGLAPQAKYWMRQAILAPIFSLLLVGFVGWLIRASDTSERKIALALFALPFLWPLIYFNSYPYFFAFILPPVAVALAPVIKLAADRYGVLALCVLMTVNAGALIVAEQRERLDAQVQVQAEIRTAFPEPVTYIDESGMVGDYQRAVPHFASGWALSNYLAKGEATYSEEVLTATVPLLLTNSDALQNIFRAQPVGDRLLAEDEALLRANFVKHSGMIYVAGKTIPEHSVMEAELIATPGEYRVESGPLVIDGTQIGPGTIVALERREYRFENLTDNAAILRWAAAGAPQGSGITLQDIYTDY